VAFLGTVLVIIEPALNGSHSGSGSFTGNFLVLLGTLSWTAYVLLTKKFLNHKISPLLLTTFMFYIGTVVMSGLMLWSRPDPLSGLTTMPISAHLGVLYMALISGGLAYWLYQLGQKHITASKADIFLYLSPVFTLLISVFWLAESVSFPVVFGCLIIAFGVILAETKLKARPG
jgi:drug/metabolite transporter (DMT)-like permease